MKNLRVRIDKNKEHAQQVLAAPKINTTVATVFEKLAISNALANIDIYQALDEETLTGLYQDYEVIDRAIMVLLTVQAHETPNAKTLIEHALKLTTNNSNEVLRKSKLLIDQINKRLDEINKI